MKKTTPAALTNLDGWKNLLTGLGIAGRDKTKSSKVDIAIKLADVELTQLYLGDGLGSRIIRAPAQDMVRAGWEVPGDEQATLYKAQQRLGVKKVLQLALTMNRLYGGCLVMMDIANSGAPDTPYNPERQKPGKLRSLKVFPSPRIDFTVTDLGNDPTSPWFEELERFRIQKRFGGEFILHRSRALVFKGLEIPDTLDNGVDYEEQYWGMSALNPVYNYLANFGSLLQGLGHLGQEFSVSKLKISNLEALVAEGDWQSVERRMEIIAMTKSLINAVLLGQDESFDRDHVTFSGVPELLDRFMMTLAGSCGIPVTRLFGRSAAGLSATGESDTQLYYDEIKSLQETDLQPELLKLLSVLNYGEGSPVDPEDLTVEFNPVWEPSQSEQATMRKTIAETDKMYLDMGVLSAEEIRESRFANGYSTELSVDPDSELPEPPETEDEEALATAGKPPIPPAPGKAPEKPLTPTPGRRTAAPEGTPQDQTIDE